VRQQQQLDLADGALQELMNNVKRAKGQPTTDVETQNITPEPGCATAAARHASIVAPHARQQN
jgi:hypothetical protein